MTDLKIVTLHSFKSFMLWIWVCRFISMSTFIWHPKIPAYASFSLPYTRFSLVHKSVYVLNVSSYLHSATIEGCYYCYMYILHNKGNKVRRSDPYHNAYITSFSDWKLTSTTKNVASNRCTAPIKHKKKI